WIACGYAPQKYFPHRACVSVEVILEDTASLWMAQLTNGTLLDLAYTFAGHFQFFAHFFQSVIVIIYQTEAELDHLSFTKSELPEHFTNLFAQQLLIGELHRTTPIAVLDDIAERIL